MRRICSSHRYGLLGCYPLLLRWSPASTCTGPPLCPQPAPRPDRGLPPQRRPLEGPVTDEARPAPRATRSSTASPPWSIWSSRTRCPSPRGTDRAVSEETGAGTEIEARIARRLAIAFWKGERAEKIEVALFDAAPKFRPPQAGFEWEEADPLTTFDLKRFNAVRGYQAQQGREISRCLKELRQLRNDAVVACTSEPETARKNEPSDLGPANDDAPAHVVPARSKSGHAGKGTRARAVGTSARADPRGTRSRAGGRRLARVGAARGHGGVAAPRTGAGRPSLARRPATRDLRLYAPA